MRQRRPFMFARTQTRRLTGTRLHPINQRAADLRLAVLLTYITLGWMTIEGAASLLLGWASKSLLLEAFGIDSVVELFSASVLLWRLRVEARGRATLQHVDLIERRAGAFGRLLALRVSCLCRSQFRLWIVYCQTHHR